VRFEINGDGERGDEVPHADPAGGLYRILVAGGSQPEGFLLDQHTSWPGALQRLLEAPGRCARLGASSVHVGSIARSGVGSEALDLMFERVLPRYPRLQAIVILVGASDVLRWMEQGTPASGCAPVRTEEVFRCHPEVRFGWKPGALALVELVRRWRRRWLRPVDVQERACSWIGKARAMRARATEVRTAMPDPTAMLDHFEQHFTRLLERARAHADRVLVVRQPWFDKEYTAEEAALMWHGSVGQAWRQDVTTFYSCAVLARVMALLDARAARIADERGIEHLDLMPIIEPSREMYYDFFHATPAGARAVATAVAAALVGHVTQPFLPLERSPCVDSLVS
jgi:lysophospholipase L1-like esterase